MNSVPTFIGAGATKSGSSWLYSILASHSGVYAPVKEVRYFNRHLAKGLDWYQSLFEAGRAYQHCGEFTPAYMYYPDVAESVHSQLPDAKVLFILRNPVQRAYSQYKSELIVGETRAKTFQGYIEQTPSALEKSKYFELLKPWLERFPASNIKIFIFESATNNVDEFKTELAKFLDLDENGFDADKFTSRENVSNPPKLKSLFRAGYYVSQLARRNGLFFISKFINKVGSKFFSMIGHSKKKAPPLENEYYKELMPFFTEDIKQLSEHLGAQSPVWS